ncbi:hypothetical protein [Chitinophaga filiformis]|uniref:Lipocalin-like domain-containing protein n=1 Tax=Chitinophaga filiformis TaxID=104663 RepID=A0ABY4HUI9_CHIFI|nr:hypothetical protein [Chitinophaga filiformis]UPK67462.1 hypothetical protein MYF79_21190 [Chitinophaga filiformis]
MKRILALLIAMTGITGIAIAQQSASDSVAILGDWNIYSIEAEIYSQKDGVLIEKMSVDPRAEVGQLKMGIPDGIRITKDSCFLRGREAFSGSYDIVRGGLLRIRQMINPGLPAIMKTYQYTVAPGSLTLTPPSVYYQDATRGKAVKVIYQCGYRRD